MEKVREGGELGGEILYCCSPGEGELEDRGSSSWRVAAVTVTERVVTVCSSSSGEW